MNHIYIRQSVISAGYMTWSPIKKLQSEALVQAPSFFTVLQKIANYIFAYQYPPTLFIFSFRELVVQGNKTRFSSMVRIIVKTTIWLRPNFCSIAIAATCDAFMLSIRLEKQAGVVQLRQLRHFDRTSFACAFQCQRAQICQMCTRLCQPQHVDLGKNCVFDWQHA